MDFFLKTARARAQDCENNSTLASIISKLHHPTWDQQHLIAYTQCLFSSPSKLYIITHSKCETLVNGQCGIQFQTSVVVWHNSESVTPARFNQQQHGFLYFGRLFQARYVWFHIAAETITRLSSYAWTKRIVLDARTQSLIAGKLYTQPSTSYMRHFNT